MVGNVGRGLLPIQVPRRRPSFLLIADVSRPRYGMTGDAVEFTRAEQCLAFDVLVDDPGRLLPLNQTRSTTGFPTVYPSNYDGFNRNIYP